MPFVSEKNCFMAEKNKQTFLSSNYWQIVMSCIVCAIYKMGFNSHRNNKLGNKNELIGFIIFAEETKNGNICKSSVNWYLSLYIILFVVFLALFLPESHGSHDRKKSIESTREKTLTIYNDTYNRKGVNEPSFPKFNLKVDIHLNMHIEK